MRPDEDFAGELVQCAREPFGQPAAVHEDQRRLVRANQLQQPRVDRRPDGGPRVADRRRSARDVVRRREAGHVLDRHLDAQRELLLRSGVHDRHGPVADRPGRRRRIRPRSPARGRAPALSCSTCDLRLVTCRLVTCDLRPATCDVCASAPPRNRETSSSGRCVAERPIRCGSTIAARHEPLDRDREVRAPLGRHQRVDFVDDDRLDAAQGVARVRREQQVERFGRRDEDVGRIALEAGALGGRRVAGADRDGRRHERLAAQLGEPARCRRAAHAGCARRRPRAP